MTAVLELQSVSKSFDGPPTVSVLDRVDLRIRRGEMVAISGPSGSGKSTLLTLMGTLARPDSGQVLVGGRSTTSLSSAEIAALRSHEIGFVFQQFHLVPGLTAVKNVALGHHYQKVSRVESKASAKNLLQRVGLGHRLSHKPGELSGGECQRVAIARALVGKPSVILADEPTGNLDPTTSEEIVDLFIDLNAAGTTIVLITHDEGIAQGFPRRVRLIDGQVIDA